MKYLLFSIVVLFSCASAYKDLSPTELDQACLTAITPRAIVTGWYDASIDVVGKHVSGLLLFKSMSDNSQRVVFTNEAGVKFFDLEFIGKNGFLVHHIIPQLDRKAVVNLLRKDFQLILQKPFVASTFTSFKNGQQIYFAANENRVNHYYITEDCRSLLQIESGSKRKRLAQLNFYGSDFARPDSLTLQHFTFAMRMTLKKIDRG